jgi:L,D-peptidoglycan transpeptidase YkuD (ErfK/YbiS/YcfS/YnhG family)
MRYTTLVVAFAVGLALPQAAWAAAEDTPQPKDQAGVPAGAKPGAQSPLAEEEVPWEGSYCPRPLHRATRLIIVTVASMDDSKAELHTFERKSPAASWTKSSGPEPCVVGARGIGWGHPYLSFRRGEEPVKEEGDERTPAGIYRIGAMFGFAEDKRPNYIQLTPGRQFCVEDTSSPYYGQIVPQSSVDEKTLGQKMASVEQYRRGIFIDYPPRRAFKAGSCIFVQVWAKEGTGTSAHIGLPEERILRLQDWGGSRFMAIAVMHKEGLPRFRRCLPNLDGSPAPTGGPVSLPLPDPRRRLGKN